MTGIEPWTLVSEATALPTEPQPLPLHNTSFGRKWNFLPLGQFLIHIAIIFSSQIKVADVFKNF